MDKRSPLLRTPRMSCEGESGSLVWGALERFDYGFKGEHPVALPR